MLNRRDLLRGLSLATLAVAASPLLTACGAGDHPSHQVKGLQLVSSDVKRSAADAGLVPAAVNGLQGLGAGLYGQLLAMAGNLAISPFSIAVALGLTVNGAKGRTQSEMLKVLGATDVKGLDERLDALTSYVDSLAGPVPGNDGKQAELILASANSLFGQTGEKWEQPFLDDLARYYGAGMRGVDWKGATEAARTAVNEWAALQTHDRITEILPDGSVDEDTRLVLVNALYFKAPWAVTFNQDDTSDEDFHLADGSTVEVPTMHNSELSAAYAKRAGYQAVQLPYSGDTVAMTLLLPDADLAPLESKVAGGGLADLLVGLITTQMELSLPTWTFRTTVALTDVLVALGMPTAFSSDADFTAMTTQEPLSISDVLHQVYVAVDEGGTEAAAVTAVEVGTASAVAPGAEVRFDRPYLFVIHDLAHGTPLFVGRVADPRG